MSAQEQQEPDGIIEQAHNDDKALAGFKKDPEHEQEPDGIIKRVVNKHENDKVLAGFKKVPEYEKDPKFTFYVYKLRIEEIFTILSVDKKLREFPIESLKEYETDLNEIAGGFYGLYGKPGLSKLPLKLTQDLIDEASTQLSTAIDYQGKGDMEKYLRHLKNCRGQLFSLKEQLEAVRCDD